MPNLNNFSKSILRVSAIFGYNLLKYNTCCNISDCEAIRIPGGQIYVGQWAIKEGVTHK